MSGQRADGREMADKPPEVVAWWMDEPIADDDPLAAVKYRARAHVDAAEVLAEVTRTGHVSVRADAIDQAASMFGDECFDIEETYDAAEAAMPGGMVDAAAHIALTLAEIQRYGLLGDLSRAMSWRVR